MKRGFTKCMPYSRNFLNPGCLIAGIDSIYPFQYTTAIFAESPVYKTQALSTLILGMQIAHSLMKPTPSVRASDLLDRLRRSLQYARFAGNVRHF